MLTDKRVHCHELWVWNCREKGETSGWWAVKGTRITKRYVKLTAIHRITIHGQIKYFTVPEELPPGGQERECTPQQHNKRQRISIFLHVGHSETT